MLPLRTSAPKFRRAAFRPRAFATAPIAAALALVVPAPSADASMHRRHPPTPTGARRSAHTPPGSATSEGRGLGGTVEVQLSEPVLAGVPARFRALTASGRLRGGLTYLWVWSKGGSDYTSSTSPEVTHVFTRAGAVLVALLVTDARGDRLRTHRRVVVEAAKRDLVLTHAAGAAAHRHASGPAIASPGRSAAAVTVAIKDFSFGPSTITIHAGDTVTWVNQGPSSHTATAGGSFDTGTLSSGQSASHLFTSAGTFNYICSIHPFMHGAVVVLASTSAGQSSEGTSSSEHPSSSEHTSAEPSSKSSTSTSAPAAETSSPRATLPNTGMNLAVEILFGIGLVSAGLALLGLGSRRRARASRDSGGRP
jgi:plastocyanin